MDVDRKDISGTLAGGLQRRIAGKPQIAAQPDEGRIRGVAQLAARSAAIRSSSGGWDMNSLARLRPRPAAMPNAASCWGRAAGSRLRVGASQDQQI